MPSSWNNRRAPKQRKKIALVSLLFSHLLFPPPSPSVNPPHAGRRPQQRQHTPTPHPRPPRPAHPPALHTQKALRVPAKAQTQAAPPAAFSSPSPPLPYTARASQAAQPWPAATPFPPQRTLTPPAFLFPPKKTESAACWMEEFTELQKLTFSAYIPLSVAAAHLPLFPPRRAPHRHRTAAHARAAGPAGAMPAGRDERRARARRAPAPARCQSAAGTAPVSAGHRRSPLLLLAACRALPPPALHRRSRKGGHARRRRRRKAGGGAQGVAVHAAPGAGGREECTAACRVAGQRQVPSWQPQPPPLPLLSLRPPSPAAPLATRSACRYTPPPFAPPALRPPPSRVPALASLAPRSPSPPAVRDQLSFRSSRHH